MQSLNEILKASGVSNATAKEKNGAAERAPAPEQQTVEEVCARCEGAGFVRRTVRLGHPDFGKAFPCDCTLDEREDQRQVRETSDRDVRACGVGERDPGGRGERRDDGRGDGGDHGRGDAVLPE